MANVFDYKTGEKLPVSCNDNTCLNISNIQRDNIYRRVSEIVGRDGEGAFRLGMKGNPIKVSTNELITEGLWEEIIQL